MYVGGFADAFCRQRGSMMFKIAVLASIAFCSPAGSGLAQDRIGRERYRGPSRAGSPGHGGQSVSPRNPALGRDARGHPGVVVGFSGRLCPGVGGRVSQARAKAGADAPAAAGAVAPSPRYGAVASSSRFAVPGVSL